MRVIAGTPILISINIVTMGIGTATATLGALPVGATHLMASLENANSQRLWLEMVIVGATTNALLNIASSGPNGGLPPIAQLVVIPFGPLVTSRILRREVTTAAVDYSIFMYKVS